MNKPVLAIFWGGFACGVLDLTSAIVAYGLRGVAPIRIPQSIAAGLLGPQSFKGGWSTATLGLVCHFIIAFSAATVFYLASRKLRFLTERPLISAFLYGEAVFLFMNFVVIPLSRTHAAPFSAAWLVTGPVGHPFFVGLPIALAVRHFAGTPPAPRQA